MPLKRPFTKGISRGVVPSGGGGGGIVSLLQSLGAVLLYDGTLNGSAIKNLGSGGSAMDGTPTDVTIDENGMNFNGTTSAVSVSGTGLGDLAAYTYLGIEKRNSVGEGGGRLWNYANTQGLGGALAGSGPYTISYQVARGTTHAVATFTNYYASLPSLETIFFMRWTGTELNTVIADAGDSAFTLPNTETDGSGTITNQAPQTLYIGNRQLNDRALDGYIRLFAILPYALSDELCTEVAIRAEILNPS